MASQRVMAWEPAADSQIRGRAAATRIRLTAWKLQPAGTFIVYRRPRTPTEGKGWATFMRRRSPTPTDTLPLPPPLADRIVANQRLALKGGLINKPPAIGGVPNRLLRLSLPPPAPRGTRGMITVLFLARERDRARVKVICIVCASNVSFGFSRHARGDSDS